MGFYPYNTNLVARAQSDVKGVHTTKTALVHFLAASALAAVANRYVVSADMKVGAYTLANTLPGDGLAHNVTVTHALTSTVDTLGTIDVVGKDLAGAVLLETITPVSGQTVQGVKAFKSITSITGVGWAVVAGADKLTVGFGDVLGLPDKLYANTVVMAARTGVREATAPTITVSPTVLAENTVDLNSALDGSNVDVWYIP